MLLLLGSGLASACGSSDDRAPTPAEVTAVIVSAGRPESPVGDAPYLLFNQHWIQGLYSQTLDLTDVDAFHTALTGP